MIDEVKNCDLEQAVEVMKGYFYERLFSIHYKYHDARIGRTNFDIASGFCTIHKGIPLFVTCAHFLVDHLGDKIQDGLVQEVSIGVPCKPKSLLRFDLDDEFLAAFKYWDDQPCQDFAIGPCDAELQRAMIVGNAKCLELNPMESSFEDKGMYFLFGFSALASKAKVNDLFYVPTESGFKMLHSADMAAFAPRCVQISTPTLLGDGRLESTLLTEGISSVEGFSGGFVVKIFPGKQIRQFEFVGIQSEQSTLDGKVISIRFSLSDIVIDCLDYFVESVEHKKPAS